MENSEMLAPLEEDVQKLTAVLPEVLKLFAELTPKSRQKLLNMIATVYGLEAPTVTGFAPSALEPETKGYFSEDRSISPKEFLLQKQPHTDVERVACLAYYLTHYRDTPYFKTLDISKLNTEAAQMKFSNAAKAVDNATMYGYLAPATKGNKQLSAGGELFVRALPDREAARDAMAHARPRRKPRKAGGKEQEEDANLGQ